MQSAVVNLDTFEIILDKLLHITDVAKIDPGVVAVTDMAARFMADLRSSILVVFLKRAPGVGQI
eukprot:SAG31_NODE_699_length_12741_cov_5.762617_6_plen_64_part_00